jgi:hypothetical protein
VTAEAAAPPRDDVLARLGELIWVRLPARLGRRSLSVGVALADGSWLRAWPLAAVLAPVAALAVGVLVGLVRPDPTYTGSVVILSVLAAVAGLGAGPGAWTWVGYVVTDLAVHRPAGGLGRSGDVLEQLWQLYVPRLLTYVLLGLLLTTMPVAATGIRIQVIRVLRLSRGPIVVASAVVQGLALGVGVVLWAQATAFMIRPLWSFVGTTPDIEAIAPLQEHAVLLGLIAGAVAAARTIVAARGTETARAAEAARAHDRGTRPRPTFDPDRRPWPWWVAGPVRAALVTLLLAGLVAGTGQAVAVFVALVVVGVVRDLALPRVAGYVATVNRVPLLVRLAVAAGIAWVAAAAVVQPAVDRGESSFTWMLAAIVVSTLSAGALIPPSPARAGGAAPPVMPEFPTPSPEPAS